MCCFALLVFVVFFFKQKTAYEMRISDWSSDVCSSDLPVLPTMGGQTALNCALGLAHHGVLEKYGVELIGANEQAIEKAEDRQKFKQAMKIGRASCRERVCQYV